MPTDDQKLKFIFKRNCFSCAHLSLEWGEEMSASSYYICSKGKYGIDEEKSNNMYDSTGKESTYLFKYKRCHDFPKTISFNECIVDMKKVIREME